MSVTSHSLLMQSTGKDIQRVDGAKRCALCSSSLNRSRRRGAVGAWRATAVRLAAAAHGCHCLSKRFHFSCWKHLNAKPSSISVYQPRIPQARSRCFGTRRPACNLEIGENLAIPFYHLLGWQMASPIRCRYAESRRLRESSRSEPV
jgi:hypothetical protein